MDKFHARQLKRAFYCYLFARIVDFADSETRLQPRRSEIPGMLLLASDMNTQGNSLRGHARGLIVD